jgi:hypothetical protein
MKGMGNEGRTEGWNKGAEKRKDRGDKTVFARRRNKMDRRTTGGIYKGNEKSIWEKDQKSKEKAMVREEGRRGMQIREKNKRDGRII